MNVGSDALAESPPLRKRCSAGAAISATGRLTLRSIRGYNPDHLIEKEYAFL